ncbi:EamA family transporter [Tissierella carlieri]|uniref:EamA family transporter n=1 Tax=Tissierella carlieri TaxID=689904 RepID=UPI003868890A
MKSIIIILIMGVFQLGIPYIFYVNSTKYLTALEAILITVMEPLLNPLWVYIFAGEKPGTYAIIGGIVVIVTVVLRGIYVSKLESVEG